MRRVIIVIFAILLCGGVAKAGGAPGLRTEFGVVAGVNYSKSMFDMGSCSAQLTMQPGFTAGLHMGLRLAGILGVQPEILYSRNKITLDDTKQNFSTDIECNSVQIPLLLSLKLALVRFNVGPVFTVVDNPTYLDRVGEKVMFGAINPGISYAAGVSVCLFKHFLVDARVSSGFKKVENFISYDAKQAGYTIKSMTFNAQLKVGVLF